MKVYFHNRTVFIDKANEQITLEMPENIDRQDMANIIQSPALIEIIKQLTKKGE